MIHFNKLILLPFLILFFGCGPLVKVERKVRTRLAYNLYVLPLVHSKVNIGYRTIEESTTDDADRIEDNLESELANSIYYNFKEKRFFLSVNKAKSISEVPSGNKILILKVINKYIKIDKEYLLYQGWITTDIKIFTKSGEVVFFKTYKLEKIESTLGSSRTLAINMYEKIIFMLINDLEIKLGGLADFNPMVDNNQSGMHRRGQFWF
jgi:hypothetical protein